jgi:hypothetical protein
VLAYHSKPMDDPERAEIRQVKDRIEDTTVELS